MSEPTAIHRYPKDGVVVQGRQVVIYLDLDGAEWLHGELPPEDGFTKDLWTAIERLSVVVENGRSDDA